jgi:predicted nicotinamide N-methyase
VEPSPGLLSRHAPVRPVEGVPSVVAHQARDVFELWQAWEEECASVQPPPFWATVWPAAAVLARCVGDATIAVAGRRVLEVGCGGGVVAIAAARCGAAAVEANDVDATALHVALLNARANGVALAMTAIDYTGASLPAVEVVLVADLFYERRASERLLARLVAARERGAEVVVADGGRPFAPRTGLEPIRDVHVTVDLDLEGVASRTVRVFRLT